MKCPHCGWETPGPKKCHLCGQKLSKPPKIPEQWRDPALFPNPREIPAIVHKNSKEVVASIPYDSSNYPEKFKDDEIDVEHISLNDPEPRRSSSREPEPYYDDDPMMDDMPMPYPEDTGSGALGMVRLIIGILAVIIVVEVIFEFFKADIITDIQYGGFGSKGKEVIFALAFFAGALLTLFSRGAGNKIGPILAGVFYIISTVAIFMTFDMQTYKAAGSLKDVISILHIYGVLAVIFAIVCIVAGIMTKGEDPMAMDPNMYPPY